ncbi:MAG TPA: hypothetical protein VIP46_10645 [Pyrinomonadaceae bacterium]
MESSTNIDGLTRAGATTRAGDGAPDAGRSRAAGRLRALLTTRRLLPFVLLSVVFALTVAPATDPDFWWHLRTGQFIAETGTVPRTDIFSHTAAGREWVAHEWLTEVLMFAVFEVAGWAGLIGSFSLVMTAALGFAYRRAAERASHPTLAGAAVLLATLACAPILGVRPQMISFLLTSVFVLLLGRYALERRARCLWPLPALMLVWANMHGAFALGLALVGVTIVGVALDELSAPAGGEARELEARKEVTQEEEAARASSVRRRLGGAWSGVRPLCVALAACAAAVALNPNGVRLFTYPLETIASGAMQRNIQEWLSPDFHRTEALPFALLLLSTFAALALSPRRPRPSELLLLAVSAYAALRSWRNIPFFALVAAPVLAEHAWLLVNERRRPPATKGGGAARTPALQLILNATLFVVVPAALCVVTVARAAGRQESVEREKYPAAAVEFLRGQKQAGPVFNAYGWGGYLVWKLHPERAVYIDGRADVYGDALVEDYLRAEAGEPGWRALLERDRVRAVMIAPDAALASLLREDEGWEKVFEDAQAVIFFKR